MKTISAQQAKQISGGLGLYTGPYTNKVIYVRPGNVGLRVPGVTYVYSAQPGSVALRK